MESLIFAVVASRKGYHQTETFVPEPARFQRFDLRGVIRFVRSEGIAEGY